MNANCMVKPSTIPIMFKYVKELLPETARKEYWKAFITQHIKDTRRCTPCKHEELGKFSVPFSWERTHSRENSVKYKQYMKTFICPTSLQNHVRMYTG